MKFLDGEWWLNPDEIEYLERWFGCSSYFIQEYPLVMTFSSTGGNND